MNEVTVSFNGQDYVLLYNEQSEYYELEIAAPENGGLYEAEIGFFDVFGLLNEDTIDVQIWAKEEVKLDLNKVFMWIFSWDDFSVKDIVELTDYEINIDEETNANTILNVLKKTTAKAKDIIAIKKNNEVIYWGTIEEIQNEDGRNSFSYTVKYITNLFDRTIKLTNENLIRTTGIEDFLAGAIADNFISNNDTFINKTYLEIVIKTHTPKQTSVTNVENGIYNLHTYMTNCTQNYDIVYSFSIVNKKLVIEIENKSYNKELIDTQAQSISSYTEVFETDFVSKVTVLYAKVAGNDSSSCSTSGNTATMQTNLQYQIPYYVLFYCIQALGFQVQLLNTFLSLLYYYL